MVKRMPYFFCPALAFFVTTTALTAQDSGLEYQNRGNYWEGLVGAPHFGPTGLSLRSAYAGIPAQEERIGENISIFFFVDQGDDINIKVFDHDGEVGYLLDNVLPEVEWIAPGWNSFSWSSKVLHSELVGLTRRSDLGFLIRLGSDSVSKEEKVALAWTGEPANSQDARYFLSVCYSNPIQLSYGVYHSHRDDPISESDPSVHTGSGCIDISVDPLSFNAIGEGEIAVRLEAESLETFDKDYLTVRFRHEIAK